MVIPMSWSSRARKPAGAAGRCEDRGAVRCRGRMALLPPAAALRRPVCCLTFTFGEAA